MRDRTDETVEAPRRHGLSLEAVAGIAPGDPLVAETGVAGVDDVRRSRMAWAHKILLLDLGIVALVGLVAAACVPTIAETHPAVTVGLLVGLVALLGTALAVGRCWHPIVVSSGGLEYTRVLQAGSGALLALALTEVALRDYRLQPYTLVVLPAAVVGVLVGRTAARALLHRRRRRGIGLTGVLVVGSDETVADLVTRTRRAPEFGWTVVGACTPAGTGEVAGVRVIGGLDDVSDAAHCVDAEVVAVTPSPGWTGRRLHRLAWELEGTDLDLVVDPGLMEIAGPRLHMTPVDGLPMIRLTQPIFRGWARVSKAVVDRLAAAVAVLLLSPVLLTIALLVKREDGGPVFFHQERVGREGIAFRMVKFRSMATDAEGTKAALDAANEAAGPLFKMRRDPRVTRIGSVLRRYSLDELPQLFNVLGGSMSLVGPRPPLPREVVEYADDARRRLLVRPGMTGLWQVSGRSDLSWDESVRLDLRYVENWSPGLDLHILARTVTAVVTGRGAY
ncbi:sugar transferase [Actinomycetospora sp. NBRC 106378]|uniref:sugar transferase n=1 Tax=Actinomycetospora sp. NBRC 106378 TaxID=3032208 RepID=UPI0024A556ED|nr:sugar transferase [Actinomycetospora sp. NBRC 106378]GLZ51852.1 exopolysaccharide biosynthesis polyprenyl glycosylphosphotransferase [Actinomycetospora sp. NBRC 106378]